MISFELPALDKVKYKLGQGLILGENNEEQFWTFNVSLTNILQITSSGSLQDEIRLKTANLKTVYKKKQRFTETQMLQHSSKSLVVNSVPLSTLIYSSPHR